MGNNKQFHKQQKNEVMHFQQFKSYMTIKIYTTIHPGIKVTVVRRQSQESHFI